MKAGCKIDKSGGEYRTTATLKPADKLRFNLAFAPLGFKVVQVPGEKLHKGS